jgi:hypothetical protein
MEIRKMKVFQQQQQPTLVSQELQHQQSWFAVGAAVVVGGSTYMSQKKGSKAPGQAAAVDPQQVQLEAIQGNSRNSPEIEALLRRANSFTQGQNLSLLDQAIPGYSQIAQNLSNQAMQASADPYALPKEFSDNLARQAAERGINTGVRGQANDFSLLRDFGVNSLQYGQQQIASSQNILQTLAGLAKVNPLSPLSMYIQPGQALQGAYQQQSADQAAMNAQQAAANRQAAAPWNALAAGVGTFAGMYGGGAGAGGGGGGQAVAQATPYVMNYTGNTTMGYA